MAKKSPKQFSEWNIEIKIHDNCRNVIISIESGFSIVIETPFYSSNLCSSVCNRI